VAVRIVPAGEAVRSVSLFADGKLLCTLEQPPYKCPWDAGPRVVEHLVRATAVLADGRQIRASIRTKGVEYTEVVDVDVVQITATVTGGGGRFVRNLKAADFRVFENGAPQAITAFAAENIPLELVVAVDVSGSMTKAMPTVKAAVRKFLTKLRPQDVVTVLGFNDNVFVIARPTVTLEGRLKTLDRLRPWGGTALYDAMLKSLAQLGPQAGRRVIVVFTDGEDLNSRVPLETANGPRIERRCGYATAYRAPDASLRWCWNSCPRRPVAGARRWTSSTRSSTASRRHRQPVLSVSCRDATRAISEARRVRVTT
jgi:hypothetical protein